MKNSLFLAALCCAAAPALAHESESAVRADTHAPIGVMAEHTHRRGEWMLSYRFMHMDMQGSRMDSQSIDADTIATSAPNRFAGQAGQPPTLRVVPLSMSMDMHMLGFMYAPSDQLTLMLMGNYLQKTMTHRTYQGGAGTTVLGEFRTQSEGWGDTRLLALWNVQKTPDWRWVIQSGFSLPTGSTEETAEVLSPMNMRPSLRMPYAMQLGSGSYEWLLGSTAVAVNGAWTYGAQINNRLSLDDNDNGYRVGSRQDLSLWASYSPKPAISLSARLLGESQAEIHGQDPLIVAPVQTADPTRQGGEMASLGLGLNTAAQSAWRGHRLGLELLIPVWQRLNGPQVETDWSVVAAWQFSR